jgi:hypothetical protein
MMKMQDIKFLVDEIKSDTISKEMKNRALDGLFERIQLLTEKCGLVETLILTAIDRRSSVPPHKCPGASCEICLEQTKILYEIIDTLG